MNYFNTTDYGHFPPFSITVEHEPLLANLPVLIFCDLHHEVEVEVLPYYELLIYLIYGIRTCAFSRYDVYSLCYFLSAKLYKTIIALFVIIMNTRNY